MKRYIDYFLLLLSLTTTSHTMEKIRTLSISHSAQKASCIPTNKLNFICWNNSKKSVFIEIHNSAIETTKFGSENIDIYGSIKDVFGKALMVEQKYERFEIKPFSTFTRKLDIFDENLTPQKTQLYLFPSEDSTLTISTCEFLLPPDQTGFVSWNDNFLTLKKTLQQVKTIHKSLKRVIKIHNTTNMQYYCIINTGQEQFNILNPKETLYLFDPTCTLLIDIYQDPTLQTLLLSNNIQLDKSLAYIELNVIETPISGKPDLFKGVGSLQMQTSQSGIKNSQNLYRMLIHYIYSNTVISQNMLDKNFLEKFELLVRSSTLENSLKSTISANINTIKTQITNNARSRIISPLIGNTTENWSSLLSEKIQLLVNSKSKNSQSTTRVSFDTLHQDSAISSSDTRTFMHLKSFKNKKNLFVDASIENSSILPIQVVLSIPFDNQISKKGAAGGQHLTILMPPKQNKKFKLAGKEVNIKFDLHDELTKNKSYYRLDLINNQQLI